MACKNNKKAARLLQKHFDIKYLEALRCVRETRELPSFDERYEKQKELGKKYPDAIFEICLEEWTYE